MNIDEHNKKINEIISDINFLLKEEYEDMGTEELTALAISKVKDAAQGIKGKLSQFYNIDAELPHTTSKSITGKIWSKVSGKSIVIIKINNDVKLPVPDTSTEITLLRGEHKFKPKSFGKHSAILFERTTAVDGEKYFLFTFTTSAEINQPNEGKISVYDTSTKIKGTSEHWSGRIIKIE